MLNQFRPTGFSMLPEVVKNLLIINGLMFLATMVLGANFGLDLTDLLGLHLPGSEKFKPYQLVTYMFMHGGFSHLFFNMFAVWMFGTTIENRWGPKRFLIYYLLTGFGAALLHYTIVYIDMAPVLVQAELALNSGSLEKVEAFMIRADVVDIARQSQIMVDYYNDYLRNQSLQNGELFISNMITEYKNAPNVVGASGSLFGILLAFGMLFPNAQLYMMFIPVPIRAKYFVIGYGAMELLSGLQNNPGDNVAHFAHLGGMLFGFLIIKYWRRKGIY